MALPLLTGDQREDQAIATGAAVAAILTSAELALAAAISAAVWKTALGHPPSRRSLERTIAVILAVAELKAERAAALGGTVPEAVTKAITAATERAYAEAVAAYEQAVAAAGSEGGVASLPRILAAQKALDDLLGKGLTGYVDRAGRNWDLATYAEMATRTGISNAIDARLARALEAEGLDLVLVTHGSEPACPKCRPYLDHLLSLTGQTPPGIYQVEDSTGRFRTAEVVATVQSAMAHGWRHPNCFPAGTLVSAPSGVDAAYSHWYEGDLVVIHTASGNELSATPNHPVLTPEGWVAAGALEVGGSVLRYNGGAERMQLVGPGDEQVPARIGEVFDSLRKASPVPPMRVPASAEQFHGDGGGSDVEVVFADRLLKHDRHAERFQGATDGPLIIGSTGLGTLLAEGSPAQVVLSALRATDGIMRGSGERLALIGSHGGEPAAHALALADGAPAGPDDFVDRVPVDAGLLLDRWLAEAGVVQPQDLLTVDAGGLGHGQFRAQDASIYDPRLGLLGADAELGGESADGLAGLVEPDQIVSLGIRQVATHVYNLQTGDGWYVADGIVVHNCRCGMEPWSDGADFSASDSFVPPSPAEMDRRYAAEQAQRAAQRRLRDAQRGQRLAMTPRARSHAMRDLAAASTALALHRRGTATHPRH